MLLKILQQLFYIINIFSFLSKENLPKPKFIFFVKTNNTVAYYLTNKFFIRQVISTEAKNRFI